MTVKLTGADFTAFMEDKSFWTDGRWYEDALVSIDGGDWFDWDNEPIAPDAKVRVDGGIVYDGPNINDVHWSLEPKIRAWVKARTVQVVVLEVGRNELAGTLLVLEKLPGVKVLS